MSVDGIASRDGDPPLDPLPLRRLLARNLRRLRLDGSASQEDVVLASRAYGLGWTASWLAAVERGQKPLSAEQLIALPFVLSDVLGHRVSLADLLLGDEPVQLAKAPADPPPAGALSPTYLREVLTAAPYRRPFVAPGTPFALSDDGPLLRAAGKMRDIGRAGLGDVDVRALARAEAGAGDLEQRLARRLRVPPIVVIAAAAGLWGHSLTEERAARLEGAADGDAPAPTPAAVIRRLTTELSHRLAEAADAAGAADGPDAPDGPAAAEAVVGIRTAD